MSFDSGFYALLVGIDHYKSSSVPDLRGCVADVQAVYAFLTTRLNVPADNIRTLTSPRPDAGRVANQAAGYSPFHHGEPATRANILAAWQEQIERLGDGDQFFFHYSGHGSQARSIDPNEPDGYDETLIPHDGREQVASADGRVESVSAEGREKFSSSHTREEFASSDAKNVDGGETAEGQQPVYDILDKELAALILRAEEKGALVTVILDCCHSGSGTRSAAEPDTTRPLARRGPRDRRLRPQTSLVPGTLDHIGGRASPAAGPSGWSLPSQHVLLAACRDEELSFEYRSPQTGFWHGATTYFLLQAFNNYRPQMTWRQVHNIVQTRVNTVYPRQLPQLEGPANRKVFGGMAVPERPHLIVTDVEQEGGFAFVKVNGGVALGLSEGSRIAVHRPGSSAQWPAASGSHPRPLATGMVERTHIDHAWARLETPMPADAIPVPSPVTITAQGYENLVYPVAVEDARLERMLKNGIEGQHISFLTPVPVDDPGAHFRVVVAQVGTPRRANRKKYILHDASGNQILTDAQPYTDEGARQTVRDLHHLAVYNNVRNLRNPSPLAVLEGAIGVEAVSYTRAGFSSPKDPVPLDSTDAVLPPGRKVWLTLRNDSKETLYLSVFNLSANYGIHRIYPERAPYETVGAGKSVHIRGLAPTVDSGLAHSREIVKIFATTVPTSFDVLELPDLEQSRDVEPHEEPAASRVREAFTSPDANGIDANGTDADVSLSRSDAPNPLDDLLLGIRRGTTRRMLVQRDHIHQHWITDQIEITVLADNRTYPLLRGHTTVELGTPYTLKLEKPETFEGDLVIGSADQLSRGYSMEESVRLPPGLTTPEAQEMSEPLSFVGDRDLTVGPDGERHTGRSRAPTGNSPLVLSFNASAEQFQSIDDESPLRLELSLPAVGTEAKRPVVLAVAFDGETYVLAGSQDRRNAHSRKRARWAEKVRSALTAPWRRPQQGDRAPGRGTHDEQRVTLTITHLPLPSSGNGALLPERPRTEEETEGEAPARDLKRTVRLFLYKIYRSEASPETGVRKVSSGRVANPSEPADLLDVTAGQVTRADIAAASRVALFIHGFAGDTNTFVLRDLPRIQQMADYDLYLTYDYETLNTPLEESGTILAQTLVTLGFSAEDNVHLDIIGHSSGALVARVMIELRGGDTYVDRLFMVGVPNGGTRLAYGRELVLWLGTVALNHAGLMPPTLIATWALKELIDSAQGIQDLQPDSSLFSRLNGSTTPINVPYYVQIGTNSNVDDAFDWRRLFTNAGLARITNAGLDQLLGGPNDMVVPVHSAENVRYGNWPKLDIAYIPGHHFEYFQTEESLEVLRHWLGSKK